MQINTGKAATPLAAAAHHIEHTYTTPTENHHPIEPHALVAVWNGANKLTIYDSTQGVMGRRAATALVFNLLPENVHVVSPFIGGGLGGKGAMWSHITLAVLAAKIVKRPVKLALTCQMMVTNVGRRPETIQKVALGADAKGHLLVMRHENSCYSNLNDYVEPSGAQTAVLYAAPLREITYEVATLNIGAPIYMRAPGFTPGSFALESAMDELAFEMKIDPVTFRILNHTTANLLTERPFSSEHLLECYQIGAERIG